MSLISAVMRNSFKNIASPCLSSYVQVFIPLRKYCIQENKSEAKTTEEKKTSPIPKITLISGSSISVTTLDEAQKISKRRDLKLVKIIDLDTKTQRPIYKLMTGSEYHQEDLKQREENKKQKNSNFIKGEKILLLNDTISDHDLEVQGKKILKWLSKSYQINVVINGSTPNMEKSERVFNFLEKCINTEGRFLQKRSKGTDLKFQIIPPKKENKEDL